MTAPEAPDAPGHPAPWWRRAVTYEIYPRSFADTDGDGEGDLAGIAERLPHLADLGVDAVWIAPWYPSPMADGGYDVTDYCDIHPRLGTLDDADRLIATAHGLGIRVIIDLVANHTSSEHPWFRRALAAGPGSPERGRYLFRDGRGDHGELPPNNWISAFSDSAWTRVTTDGVPEQWYLHTFAREQPDLDWTDGDVRREFDRVLRFWLDRGVDGFRIDAVPAMAKVPGLPDARYSDDLRFASNEWMDNPHWDVDGVHDVLRHWRTVLDEYEDRMFVAEAVVAGPHRLARYLRPDELHTAFNFGFVHARWDPGHLRDVIRETLDALGPVGAPATWALSSHDETRHVTRFGRDDGWVPMGFDPHRASDLERGTRRARAAALLMLALPGGAYVYQGEELGLPEVDDLPDEVLQDPVFHHSNGRARGRDGCRVPLPWAGDEPPFGFSPPGVRTWLPQPRRWRELTVERQREDDASMLNLYRRALALRRRLPGLAGEHFRWIDSPPDVLDFGRGGGFRCVVNLGEHDLPLPGEPLLASGPLPGGTMLPPDTAAWLQDQ